MKKVIDAKKAFEGFIEEAKKCADNGLGAAAMLVAFSALVAAADADTQSDDLKKQIRAFVDDQYSSYGNWFIHQDPRLAKDSLADWLYNFRNGMSHVVSMPHGLAIVFNRENAQLDFSEYKMFIDIDKFISAVQNYIKNVMSRKPNDEFDKNKRANAAPRGPAIGTQIGADSVAASAAVSINITSSIP